MAAWSIQVERVASCQPRAGKFLVLGKAKPPPTAIRDMPRPAALLPTVSLNYLSASLFLDTRLGPPPTMSLPSPLSNNKDTSDAMQPAAARSQASIRQTTTPRVDRILRDTTPI